MGRRVLITGLDSFWGGRMAQALESDPEVEMILGMGTGEPDWPAAASRFIVPITLISCRARLDTRVESTTRNVWTMVSTWVAATMRDRIE